MIVVMNANATEGQVLAVQKRIRELGFKDHLSRGAERTIIGVLGPIYSELTAEFSARRRRFRRHIATWPAAARSKRKTPSSGSARSRSAAVRSS
jgi:hypothetical protein